MTSYGEPFNPRWAFDVLVIPRGLAARKELTGDAKILYSRMAALASKSGICWAKQETLAEEAGVGLRSAKRHIASLEEHGLIRSAQRGRGFTNEYLFLRHPWLEDAGHAEVQTGNFGTSRSAKLALPLPMSSGLEVGSTIAAAPQRRSKIRAEADGNTQPDEPVQESRAARERRTASVRAASEPVLGADRRVVRRITPDSAWGLAQEFKAAAQQAYTRKELAFGQFNDKATARHIAEWLRDGATAAEVRVMIEIFMTGPMPDVALYKAFLRARNRLSVAAGKFIDTQRPAAERYAIPDPEAPRPAPEFRVPDPPAEHTLDTRFTTRSTRRRP